MDPSNIVLAHAALDTNVRERALRAIATTESEETRNIIMELLRVLEQRSNLGWMRTKYRLTATEFKVLNIMFSGKSPKQISEETGTKLTTVRVHIRNIYNKTQVSNMAELVAKMLQGP